MSALSERQLNEVSLVVEFALRATADRDGCPVSLVAQDFAEAIKGGLFLDEERAERLGVFEPEQMEEIVTALLDGTSNLWD